MSTVREIYAFLNQKAPFSSQMSFDNSGLLVGDWEQTVSRVLVTLDVTEETAQEAVQQGCQLIVSHHPVIFHPVKRILAQEDTGRILRTLIRGDVSVISCHTNLDMAAGGVNDCLAEAAGLTDVALLGEEGHYQDGTVYGLCRVGVLAEETGLADYLAQLNRTLRPNGMRVTDAGRPVYRVAVGGGACGEYLPAAAAAGCDTFLTADVKYNGFLDAKALGINLIDAGHYPTENVVCPRLKDWLQAAFSQLDVILTEKHREVFSYFKQNF